MTGEAVIYLRPNLPKQLAHCERGATELGLPIKGAFSDDGSAQQSNLARPGLQEAFEALEPGDTLIVSTWDRISRHGPASAAGAKFLIEKAVRVVTVTDGGPEFVLRVLSKEALIEIVSISETLGDIDDL